MPTWARKIRRDPTKDPIWCFKPAATEWNRQYEAGPKPRAGALNKPL